jgi:tetratricopeptide (TPR) repeat protein
LNRKAYAQAAHSAGQALTKGPDNIKALYRRGLARNHLGLHEEALNDLNKALTLDPENKPVKVQFFFVPFDIPLPSLIPFLL